MSYDELKKIIKGSNGSDWIKGNGELIYKNNLDISIVLSGDSYPRKDDPILNGDTYDEFFYNYGSNQLIDVNVLFKTKEIITYNWLYKPDVVIPLPVAANRITEFFKYEYDIAKLLSKDEIMFELLLFDTGVSPKVRKLVR